MDEEETGRRGRGDEEEENSGLSFFCLDAETLNGPWAVRWCVVQFAVSATRCCILIYIIITIAKYYKKLAGSNVNVPRKRRRIFSCV
jgi:hypothetical protein